MKVSPGDIVDCIPVHDSNLYERCLLGKDMEKINFNFDGFALVINECEGLSKGYCINILHSKRSIMNVPGYKLRVVIPHSNIQKM